MNQAQHLRDSLERARSRLDDRRKLRARYKREMDGTPFAQRTLRKLVQDEKKADTDIGWLQRALGLGAELEGR